MKVAEHRVFMSPFSGELDHKVPLEGPRSERLEAVLTWPSTD